MHESVMVWCRTQVETRDLAALRTLEVGSFNVNGSVRELFTGDYIGIDRYAGPGVDIVMDAENLGPMRGFPVVISTEALEHADRPWQVVAEMARVLVPGGTLIVTCRGFTEEGSFGYHNPPDRWRLGPGVLALLARDAGLTVLEDIVDPQTPGWFLVATKPA